MRFVFVFWLFMITQKFIKFFLFLVIPFLAAGAVFAAAGGIDSISRYAWTENAGWLDFGTSQGNVDVGDAALTGYAWGENLGWISLNCANTDSCAAVDYKAANDGAGNLSGYAWGENTGWINFAPAGGGVTINSSGEFSGYAWGENTGWIVFNCATTDSCASVGYKVKTAWRQASEETSRRSGGSSGGQYIWTRMFSETNTGESDAPGTDNQPSLVEKIIQTIKAPITGFLGPKPAQTQPQGAPGEATPENPPENIEPPQAELEEIAVPVLATLPTADEAAQNESKFSFLPESLLNFAKKFPELFNTLKQTGVDALGGLQKLKNITFNFSGLAQKMGLNQKTGQTGQELLNRASSDEKEKIPAEIIFARLGNMVDLPVAVACGEDAAARQQIAVLAAKPLELAVKPEFPAKTVKGVIALAQSAKKEGMAREIFTSIVLAQNEVVEFDYQDGDGDGIFLAQIEAPAVVGRYELTTKIEYQNEAMPQKELGATLLIDPEGYIFEKNGGKETRIPEASVALFWENPQTKKYELWPAAAYQQTNPQTTDIKGTYAFLVPQGNYYLQVDAPGYPAYRGKAFAVTVGAGVHQNIELKPQFNWLMLIDWKTILSAALVIIMAVIFWRGRKRNREI